MSNRTITIRNISSETVLVGARYLFPGEERVVLESHYDSALGKERLQVMDPPAPEVEPESAEIEPESKPASSRKRSSK